MAMHVQDTISSQLDQLEDLQVKAVAFAVQAEQEGEDDARLCEMFPRADWPQFYPPPPYVPEPQPCGEDGCDTPTRTAICDPCHAEFLAELSPSARAFLTGQPAPAAPFTASQLDEAYYRGRVDAATQMLKVRPTPRPPKLSWEDRAAENRGELGYDEHGNWGPLPKAEAAPAPAVDRAAAFWEDSIVVEDSDDNTDVTTILSRSDGLPLFVTGKSHAIVGHPGSGKSMLALDLIKRLTAKRGRVIYADFEDTARTVLRRARAMGMEGEVINISRMRYVVHAFYDPDHAASREGAKAWLLNIDDHDPEVDPTFSAIIIDSMESSGCPGDGADPTDWWNAHVEDWLPTKDGKPGVSVIMLDHPAKKKDMLNKDVISGIGSTFKTGKLSGTSLVLEGGVTWTPKSNGHKMMKVVKDRPGGTETAQGKVAAEVFGETILLPDGTKQLRFRYEPPTAEVVADGGENLDERLLAAVAEAGPEGVTTLEELYKLAGATGKNQVKHKAVKRIIARGWVHEDASRKKHTYTVTPDGQQHLLTGSDAREVDDDGEAF